MLAARPHRSPRPTRTASTRLPPWNCCTNFSANGSLPCSASSIVCNSRPASSWRSRRFRNAASRSAVSVDVARTLSSSSQIFRFRAISAAIRACVRREDSQTCSKPAAESAKAATVSTVMQTRGQSMATPYRRSRSFGPVGIRFRGSWSSLPWLQGLLRAPVPSLHLLTVRIRGSVQPRVDRRRPDGPCPALHALRSEEFARLTCLGDRVAAAVRVPGGAGRVEVPRQAVARCVLRLGVAPQPRVEGVLVDPPRALCAALNGDELARATGVRDRPRVSASAGCGLGSAQPHARLVGDVRRRSHRDAGESLIDLSRHFLPDVRLEGGGKICAVGHATRVPTFCPHSLPQAAYVTDRNAL